MRLKLIANPAAGRYGRAKIARAEGWLRRQGAEVDLTLTGARGDARSAAARARQEGFDRVIAAGGDGTLNEVINGLAPSAIPLAFLPLGTANLFALETGIPFAIEPACAVALHGEPRPVCLGLAGETRFVLMAGIGFDAQVVYGLNLRLKRWTGKLAYLAGALGCLLRGAPQPIEVEAEDGRRFSGYGAIVANCRAYAGRFTFTPQASLTANSLELCLLQGAGRLGVLRAAARLAAGLPPGAGALCLPGRRFLLRGAGVPVQIDGDFLGRLPLAIEARCGELQMVFPAGYGERRKQ
ncbi:MAG: NAD(+)/NADH kinase [Desulfuromonadales bacterium]|nr:NAD(+)/NADH kinase [Desulfuromonadales bacterium]